VYKVIYFCMSLAVSWPLCSCFFTIDDGRFEFAKASQLPTIIANEKQELLNAKQSLKKEVAECRRLQTHYSEVFINYFFIFLKWDVLLEWTFTSLQTSVMEFIIDILLPTWYCLVVFLTTECLVTLSYTVVQILWTVAVILGSIFVHLSLHCVYVFSRP